MVIFERLAQLLLPVEGAGTVVETDVRWRLDQRLAHAVEDVIVWGRPPLASGAGFASARRFAGARRRALVRLRRRPPGRLRAVDAVWWMPPAISSSRFKQSLKNALSAGAAMTLSRGGKFERVLDRAWTDAGYEGRPGDPRPSSGGSLRVDVDGSDHARIFRVGFLDSAIDPRAAGRALALLEQAGIDRAPRLVKAGISAQAGWTIETRVDGRRPPSLTSDLVAEVVDMMSALPRGDAPPQTFDADVATIAEHFPAEKERIERLTTPARERINALPSILRHGDLWLGNLLERDSRLVGVVDWDAAHASGVPGTDLVHLLAGDLVGGSLGDRFIQKPWRSEEFTAATASYWSRLGIEPDTDTLDAIGVAWWAGQIAANAVRLPHLASDPAWVRANVENALDAA